MKSRTLVFLSALSLNCCVIGNAGIWSFVRSGASTVYRGASTVVGGVATVASKSMQTIGQVYQQNPFKIAFGAQAFLSSPAFQQTPACAARANKCSQVFGIGTILYQVGRIACQKDKALTALNAVSSLLQAIQSPTNFACVIGDAVAGTVLNNIDQSNTSKPLALVANYCGRCGVGNFLFPRLGLQAAFSTHFGLGKTILAFVLPCVTAALEPVVLPIVEEAAQYFFEFIFPEDRGYAQKLAKAFAPCVSAIFTLECNWLLGLK